jgi:hypothetical protein
LGALQEDAGTLEVARAVVRVKRQRRDHGVGGLADLAEGDQWISPPEAAPSGVPRRDDSPC